MCVLWSKYCGGSMFVGAWACQVCLRVKCVLCVSVSVRFHFHATKKKRKKCNMTSIQATYVTGV